MYVVKRVSNQVLRSLLGEEFGNTYEMADASVDTSLVYQNFASMD